MRTLSTALPLLFGAALVVFNQKPLQAGILTLSFETFPGGTPIADGTMLATQFPGVTFSNATVITEGISLNEFELPPHSGENVVFDDGGPIAITFATPTAFLSGYFTYYEPLTLAAFDASDNQVATATSLYSINVACDPGPNCLGDPGSSPNEFLSVAYSGGISMVTITGDPAGSSFVIDDMTYNTSSVAEPPQTLALSVLMLTYLLLPHKKSSAQPSISDELL